MLISTTNAKQEEVKVSWEELLGQSSYTVLYFYPKDDTPGCTLEAIEFEALAPKFQEFDCQIIGISKDSHSSHCNFMKKHKLNFQLITDDTGALHEQFGTWGQKSMFGKKYMGTLRTTFLLDKSGKIIEERKNVSAKDHAEKVLEKVQKVVMGK
jgi:peroxiredoxin Q/BCP